MNVFIIIPGHNEQEYVSTVLSKVKAIHPHLIFVDDGSTDTTAALAKAHTKHVLIHETNLGKGAALKTGCEYAFTTLKADAVIFMDADDQHDPKEIPKFIAQLANYDVVFGVRKMGANMPLSRFLGNKFASVLLNILYGGYIPDIPSGYKALTAAGYRKVKWKSSGYEVETEIAMRVTKEQVPYAMIEIEAIYHDTDKGMTLIDGIHICRCLLEWKVGL